MSTKRSLARRISAIESVLERQELIRELGSAGRPETLRELQTVEDMADSEKWDLVMPEAMQDLALRLLALEKKLSNRSIE